MHRNTAGSSTRMRNNSVPSSGALCATRPKFGQPYCPCRLRSGDEEKDRAIECPCVYHKDEVANQGSCHCRLYFKDT